MAESQEDALDMKPGTEATIIRCGRDDVIIYAEDGALDLDSEGSVPTTRTQAIEIATALLGVHGITLTEEWGIPDHWVVAQTDCAMSPVAFMAEGPVGAYEDADHIAGLIRAEADDA